MAEISNETLERLMDTYGDSIIKMCYIYLKDWHMAEEVAQETFIKAYKHFDNFRNESEEKTWMMRIAINTCKNYKRTNWFRKVNIGIGGMEKNENIIDDLEEKILRKIENRYVLEQVHKLDGKYKEVILLYYYQEMKVSEIAEVLDIKEGTVKVRLQRARQKLGDSLSEVRMYE